MNQATAVRAMAPRNSGPIRRRMVYRDKGGIEGTSVVADLENVWFLGEPERYQLALELTAPMKLDPTPDPRALQRRILKASSRS